MPKNAKKGAYKEKEFDIYVLWKFLPAHFRGMKKKELITLGFTDPFISKIIKIKSQTEFAKYFHIKDLGTLTDWNNKIKNENIAPPSLITDYQKQHLNINQKIILPNIVELKEKISKQDKIISSLRKENILLKMRVRTHVPNKKRGTIKSTTGPREITSPIKSETHLPENKVSKNIFQKFKNLFQK